MQPGPVSETLRSTSQVITAWNYQDLGIIAFKYSILPQMKIYF